MCAPLQKFSMEFSKTNNRLIYTEASKVYHSDNHTVHCSQHCTVNGVIF